MWASGADDRNNNEMKKRRKKKRMATKLVERGGRSPLKIVLQQQGLVADHKTPRLVLCDSPWCFRRTRLA